jgi:hypothetical protein
MSAFLEVLIKLVSILMLLLFAASILLLILTYRKPKKISLKSIAITAAVSFLSLLVFSVLSGYRPSFFLWLLLAVIGVVIGSFWAKTTQVFSTGDQVMSRNSVWYLVAWGAIFALAQLITIITNRPPEIAMAMLVMSTGTVWGTNGSIVNRYLKISTGKSIGDQLKTYLGKDKTVDPYQVYKKRFASLKADFEAGKLSAESFRSALEELRFEDADGTWWQIAEDGRWLKWDGSQWVFH